MTLDTAEKSQSEATTLCKSCGLCCTGHLFAWTKLKSTELKSAEALGLKGFGPEPKQRGFNQPCPLWDGQCTIYDSPHYPHYCRLYKCALLKKVMDDSVSLPEALSVVQQTKKLIGKLELMLPGPGNRNFRERLVYELEHGNADVELQQKAHRLLLLYKNHFGVKDFIHPLDEAINSD